MPFRMGPWEVGLILMIIFTVFGAGKLPQIGNAIGKGLHAFRRGRDSGDDDEEEPAPKNRTRVATSYAKK